MQISYKEKFTVKFHEGDFKCKAKLFTIIDYIQQAVENHANILGVDFQSMMDKGLFWVVSRIEIHMDRYPLVGEAVTIETTLGGREKVFMKRRFNILDKDGNSIGKALIYYLILDMANRFPQKPTICPINIDINVGDVVDNKLGKIKMPGDPIEVMDRKLRYNDIDINNHVNNAKYVCFVEDFFPLEWHKENNISYMQLNFIKEIKCNDSLKINKFLEDEESKTYCINGTSEKSNQEFFQCRVRFKS
ncbi:acyl-ACP thioesterase domain-containing protein [Clostridium sp.]|uniref:acyl-[acyl-carrier-protein] thioesterase n=1 Tax=Clostridium sp. TaxID=1506 RepID=UPI003217FC8D